MFAVIEYKNEQYRVSPGETLLVQLIKDAKKGSKIELDKVLLIAEDDGSDVKIGTPYLNSSVEMEILGEEMGEKIRVFKMKAKKRYRKTIGSRAKFTKVKITKIGKVTIKKSASAKESVKEEKEEKKVEKVVEKKEAPKKEKEVVKKTEKVEKKEE